MAPLEELLTEVANLVLGSKTAAKNKNYVGALKYMNEALKLADKHNTSPFHIITLLDYRHAIYIRQNDLDAALKDAKAMIRLDRKDARGYVTCGSVETLRGGKQAALKYLEHGLRSVSASDVNLPLLQAESQKIRDQLTADLVASKPQDPMTTLPLEIVEFILSYIDFRQKVRMLRVSRAWKRILTAIPPLTDTLAFPGAPNPVIPMTLLSTLRRLKVPHKVIFTYLSRSASSILIDRLRTSPSFRSLQSFELNDAAASLEKLPLDQWDLRSIVIGEKTSCTERWVAQILQSCPSLKVLKCDNVVRHASDELFRLSSGTLVGLMLRNRQSRMHVRKASSIGFAIETCLHVQQAVVLDLPRLRSLCLFNFWCGASQAQNDSADHERVLDLTGAEQLQSVTFHHCGFIDVRFPPSLKFLEMIDWHDLLQDLATVNSGEQVPMALENLQTLNLIERPGVWSRQYPRFIRRAMARSTQYPRSIQGAMATTKSGTLTSLTLTANDSWPQTFIDTIASPWFKALKSLSIVDKSTITNDHHQVLLDGCPNLEELSISNASITGVFLSSLITAPKSKIHTVSVQDCAKISGDIVSWAKERGVKISMSSSVSGAGGRRVREG